MANAPIDLDANATTPLLPAAWEAMQSAFQQFGNPSSAHANGRRARQLLEDARERIAHLLGASPEEVIFTSGATEANNLALFGLIPPNSRVLASPIEHPCVIEPLRQRGGVEWLPVSAEGIVSAKAEERASRSSPGWHRLPAGAATAGTSHEYRALESFRLEAGTTQNRLEAGSTLPKADRAGFVTVMLANHETGAIQPIREIASALPAGVLFHTDAAQAVGKIPVHFHDLGITSLSASAHKFRGPQGVGILLLKKGTPLIPRTFGGHQQQGRRPGTEPVALVVGMAVALEAAVKEFPVSAKARAHLWERLHALASPIVLNGPAIGSPDALPTTLNVSFPGCRGDLLLMALDLAGVACSTGSACSSGSLLPSPVLRAMGVPDEVLRAALRFSFDPTIALPVIDEAAERIAKVVHKMCGM